MPLCRGCVVANSSPTTPLAWGLFISVRACVCIHAWRRGHYQRGQVRECPSSRGRCRRRETRARRAAGAPGRAFASRARHRWSIRARLGPCFAPERPSSRRGCCCPRRGEALLPRREGGFGSRRSCWKMATEGALGYESAVFWSCATWDSGFAILAWFLDREGRRRRLSFLLDGSPLCRGARK